MQLYIILYIQQELHFLQSVAVGERDQKFQLHRRLVVVAGQTKLRETQLALGKAVANDRCIHFNLKPLPVAFGSAKPMHRLQARAGHEVQEPAHLFFRELVNDFPKPNKFRNWRYDAWRWFL